MKIVRYTYKWFNRIRLVANSLWYMVRAGDTFQSDGLCCNYRMGCEIIPNATLLNLGSKRGKAPLPFKTLTGRAEGLMADIVNHPGQGNALVQIRMGGGLYAIT